MKKILALCLFLSLIFGVCLWNIHVVSGKTTRLIGLIEQSEALIEAGEPTLARETLLEVKALWEQDDLYYCTMLRHSETDEIYTALRTTLGALDAGDHEDFLYHCSELRSHLELVRETERYTLGNIL